MSTQGSFCMSMCWNIHYKVTITGTSSEGKKGRGEQGKQGTHYTIHLWDSRSVTRNYILFLVDYTDYINKNLVPAPTVSIAVHPEGSNGFSLAPFLYLSFHFSLFLQTLPSDTFYFLLFSVLTKMHHAMWPTEVVLYLSSFRCSWKYDQP